MSRTAEDFCRRMLQKGDGGGGKKICGTAEYKRTDVEKTREEDAEYKQGCGLFRDEKGRRRQFKKQRRIKMDVGENRSRTQAEMRETRGCEKAGVTKWPPKAGGVWYETQNACVNLIAEL